MNKYNIMYGAIFKQYEEGLITLEDAQILNDTAYDRYICEFTFTHNNKNLVEDTKTCKKIIKDSMKEIESNIRKGNFDVATELIDDTRKALQSLYISVKNCPEDKLDIVLPIVFQTVSSIILTSAIEITLDKYTHYVKDLYSDPDYKPNPLSFKDIYNDNTHKVLGDKTFDTTPKTLVKDDAKAVLIPELFNTINKIRAGEDGSLNPYRNKAIIAIKNAETKLDKLENKLIKAEAKALSH